MDSYTDRVSETATRVRLQVSPGGGRSEVVGRHGDAWKVRVAENPERGKANEAVLRLLAESLSLPRRDVRLISGRHGRTKLVELGGLERSEAERRLAALAEKDG